MAYQRRSDLAPANGSGRRGPYNRGGYVRRVLSRVSRLGGAGGEVWIPMAQAGTLVSAWVESLDPVGLLRINYFLLMIAEN